MTGRLPEPRAVNRRRLAVLAELTTAVGICLLGYYVGAPWFRVHEARWTVAALRLLGQDQFSDVLDGHILIFRADGEMLNGQVTTSCSAILTVVGLTALTVAILRDRRLPAAGGLLVALVAVVVANDLRLIASSLAGYWWGRPAMILFHDWAGTVWTLAATLGSFLLMVCVTLPNARRAEQDVAGRHTARRPSNWARPGLGYRLPETEAAPATMGRNLAGLMHRYLLPRPVSRRLAARREAGRIDYRIGYLPAEQRMAAVRALVADGLGAHTASLLAVATYDTDAGVLDTLATAVAARQWEPVTNERIASLRLWARGWLLTRGTADPVQPSPSPSPSPSPVDDTRVVRGQRPAVPAPAARTRAARTRAVPAAVTRPRTFARPAPAGSVDLREET